MQSRQLLAVVVVCHHMNYTSHQRQMQCHNIGRTCLKLKQRCDIRQKEWQLLYPIFTLHHKSLDINPVITDLPWFFIVLSVLSLYLLPPQLMTHLTFVGLQLSKTQPDKVYCINNTVCSVSYMTAKRHKLHVSTIGKLVCGGTPATPGCTASMSLCTKSQGWLRRNASNPWLYCQYESTY